MLFLPVFLKKIWFHVQIGQIHNFTQLCVHCWDTDGDIVRKVGLKSMKVIDSCKSLLMWGPARVYWSVQAAVSCESFAASDKSELLLYKVSCISWYSHIVLIILMGYLRWCIIAFKNICDNHCFLHFRNIKQKAFFMIYKFTLQDGFDLYLVYFAIRGLLCLRGEKTKL